MHRLVVTFPVFLAQGKQVWLACLDFSEVEGILNVSGLHRALPLGESRGHDAFDGDGGHRLVGGGPGEVAAAPLHLQKGGRGFREEIRDPPPSPQNGSQMPQLTWTL